MRILVDARYLSRTPSGIGTYSRYSLEYLARIDQGNEYIVITQPGFPRPDAFGPNFTTVEIDTKPLSIHTILGLQKEIRRYRPDFFHAHCPVTPIVCPAPMIATVHDLQPLQMPEWTGGRLWPVRKAYDAFYRFAYPSTFRRARVLISVSNATRRAMIERWPDLEAKTHVVHHGIPPDAMNSVSEGAFEKLTKRWKIDDPYVLYIGSTRPNKNIPGMIRAFAQARRLGLVPGNLLFVLILVKDRFFTDIARAIADENVLDYIRVVDPAESEEKRAWYRNARALFFATRFEGFGFPVLEAQLQDLPVLASRTDALIESGGEGAIYADPESVDSMAESLGRIVTDLSLRTNLIAKGRRNLERFSWERHAESVLSIYNSMK
jgi:glycosyltransferase involved in cell wall biosynthesis